MLDTVLGCESYLFTAAELATVARFQAMSYSARYLFIRLFVRRPGYFRTATLTRYARDVPDINASCQELCAFASLATEQRAQRQVTPPKQRTVIVIDGSPEVKTFTSPLEAEQPPASTSQLALDAHERDVQANLGVFAEDQTNLYKRANLEELAKLVSVEELKVVAKQMNLSPPKIKKNGKLVTIPWTRHTITKALRSQSSGQSTLFNLASSAPTQMSGGIKQQHRSLALSFSMAGKKQSQTDLIVHKLMHIIGPVIKLNESAIQLFLRLHLVFHRCATPPTQNTLTNALLSRFEKRSYPDYTITRQFAIFPDRDALLEFERAVRLEQHVEAILEIARSPCGGHRPSATSAGGTVKKGGQQLEQEVEAWQRGRRAEKRRRWSNVKDVFETSWRMWRQALETEQATRPQVTDPADPDDRRTYYLRRFRPGWVLTHCLFASQKFRPPRCQCKSNPLSQKSMDALAYFHEWDREAEVLRALLSQTYFCRGRRGKWWDRLALILMEHGLRSTPLPLKHETKQEPSLQPEKCDDDDDDDLIIVCSSKRSQEDCRREALKICWAGLADKWCHLGEFLHNVSW